MDAFFTTGETPQAARSGRWQEMVSATYFPLDLRFRHAETFRGQLARWQLGKVSLSRLTADGLQYRRTARHLSGEREEQYLVTVPSLSDVRFAQCARDIRCPPGGFLIERGHEPYEFSHGEANDLWVLKVPGEALLGRLRRPNRFCSMTFDANSSAGGLFADILRLMPNRLPGMSPAGRSEIGRQLVDLLILAVASDERALTSAGSSVRAAHLARVEQHVRQNLGERDLKPEDIASACGISVRYLHGLFQGSDLTLGEWIRDQRLHACREALGNPADRRTIAEIAYHWGFGDQAQLSRQFKARFGVTPRDYRSQQIEALRG
jgi:AraC-like DNA-binding protein